MSSGYNQSAQKPAFGVQDQMVSNADQGVPVAYFSGTRKVTATWISPVYNLTAYPAGGGKKGGDKGKGGGGGANQQYNYFGTIAGVMCVGPVTGLRSIIVGGQEQWPSGTAWANGLTINAGGIYVYDAQPWIALTNHTASYSNAPGDPTHWAEYVFSPTTELSDDITVPIQGSANPGKGKNSTGAPSTYGTLRIYWGKPGQGQDAALASTANDYGHNHPAYQGLCYVVLENWFLGTNSTTAPNLELVLQRAPVQSVITGSPAALTDGQACLATVLAEVITDQNLLGQPSSIIDSTSFQNAANYLDANTSLTAASVLLTTQDTIRSLIEKIVAMTDCYVRYNPSTGKIEMGVYEHGITPSTYTTLSQTMLTERPKLTNSGWSEVKTRAVTRFNDRTLAYQANSIKADDPAAFTVVQEHRSLDLDRPFMTRASSAMAHAAETLKTVGRPVITGDLMVRREIGRNIRPGSYVLLDMDLEPNVTSIYEFVRVTQRTIPPTGPIKISVAGDNTLSPVIWTGTTPPVIAVQNPVPALTAVRMLEAPFKLVDASRTVIALAERPSGLVTGFHLYFDTVSTGSYVLLGGQTAFAVKATLTSAVATGDATISINAAAQTDLDLLTSQPGATAAADDTLLAFLVSVVPSGTDAGEVAEDSNGLAEVEVISISAQTLVSAGNYTLAGLRGRLGTTARAFTTANTEVWIIARSGIQDFTHGEFATIASNRTAGTTPAYGYFRLTPFTYVAEAQLSTASSIQFHFPPGSLSAPTLTLTSPTFPVIVSPTYPYSFTISGTWASANSDLTSWQVLLEKSTDTAPRVIGSGIFPPTGSASFNVTASLETAGTYIVTLIAYDAAGLSSTFTGNIAASGAGAKCAPPVISFGGRQLSTSSDEYIGAGPFTATCQTPGATIYWSYRTTDWSTPTSNWSSFSTPVSTTSSPPIHIVRFTQSTTTIYGPSGYVGSYNEVFPITYQDWQFYATAPGFTNSDTVTVRVNDANYS